MLILFACNHAKTPSHLRTVSFRIINTQLVIWQGHEHRILHLHNTMPHKNCQDLYRKSIYDTTAPPPASIPSPCNSELNMLLTHKKIKKTYFYAASIHILPRRSNGNFIGKKQYETTKGVKKPIKQTTNVSSRKYLIFLYLDFNN